MAATITHQAVGGEKPLAPQFVDRIRFQGDSSYPQTTGGYPMDLGTLLPGKTILGVTSNITVGQDWITVYDRANDKMKVVVISTGAEVANGVNLGALDVELLVFSV